MQDISFILLGFLTGLSLILAIGAQNIFVIEQGLKKQYVFLVCLICSISDFLLIFFGIFLFEYFRNFFTDTVELIFNILLLVFLIYFIITKIKIKDDKININFKDKNGNTALHHAVFGKRPENITFLINSGADPGLKNKKGLNPKELALKKKNEALAQLFP